MECDICLTEWDPNKRIPRLLSCGHTFCQECLIRMLQKSKKEKKNFQCPTCNTIQENLTDEKDILKLIKNYNLLQIAEKIEERKTTNRGTNASIQNLTPLNLKDRDSITSKNNIVNPKNSQKFFFDINRKCAKHNLVIHSYAAGTNILFCDKCIEETKMSTLPLPNTIKDLRRRIDSSQFKACITKNQISQLKRFFESYLIEFEKENSSKIEELFSYFNKIVEYFHNSAKQLLSQCVSEQKLHISSYLEEMKKLSLQLTKIEKDLNEMINKNDISFLLHNIEKIRKIENRMINFINYDLEFDLLSMKIGFNEKEKENLLSSFQKSFYTQVEFFEIQNKLPSIRQILKVDESWPCICDEVNNSLNEVKCSSCGLFRRYETLGHNTINYYDDIDTTTSQNLNNSVISNIERELDVIKQIKEEESNEFKYLIKINDKKDKRFYAVDLDWFNSWKNFVQKNKEIPPGPITNNNLVNLNNSNGKDEVKMKMIKNKDFIIVEDEVWDFFFLNFNGGPCIELIDDKHIKIEDSVVKINGDLYSSYTQIKEEFIDEDDKDENIDTEYENDEPKIIKKYSGHNNGNKNNNSNYKSPSNKSNFEQDDVIQNNFDDSDDGDLPLKLINKYRK